MHEVETLTNNQWELVGSFVDPTVAETFAKQFCGRYRIIDTSKTGGYSIVNVDNVEVGYLEYKKLENAIAAVKIVQDEYPTEDFWIYQRGCDRAVWSTTGVLSSRQDRT